MDVPPQFQSLIQQAQAAEQRYLQGGDVASLDAAVAAWDAILTDARFAEAPEPLRLAVLNNASNTLGYRYAARGQVADLDRAIEHAQAAVDQTPADSPDLPSRRNNLGLHLSERYARSGQLADLDAAIRETQAAVDQTPADSPNLPAMRTNLGVHLSARYARSGQLADLDAAIRETQAAVDQTPADSPDLPSRRNNLGKYLSERYRHDPQVYAADLEEAIAHYRAAIAGYGDAFPIERRRTADNLGGLLYQQQRYPEARQAFEQAHAAIQQLASFEQSEAARLKMSADNALLYARLVFCCLHAGDTEAAFAFASAGKGRAFVDLLHSARFDLAAVGADQPELLADIERARALRAQIDAILAHLTGESGSERGDTLSPPADLKAELERLYAEHKAHWEEMARNYPALTATQRAPDMDADAACSLARNLGAVLVEFFQHAQGWCAFVVTAERVQHVALDGLTDDLLSAMQQWANRVRLPAGRGPPSYEQLPGWYRAIIAPLHDYLPPGGRVVLAPEGVLHLLPFGVARNPETAKYASEEYVLATTPSLAALFVVWKNAQQSSAPAAQQPRSLLVAAYPGAPNSPHYLPNVLPEADTIVEHFDPVKKLPEAEATPDAVVQHSSGKEVIHLGCHGYFDINHPEQSGLLLAGGWLTVQRIITDLKLQQNRLFTMGACVSGRTDLKAGDELVGLSQAALTAGARVVVASQWHVHDTVTRALFEAFYGGVQAGQSPAQAMQAATGAVRQRPEWAHPYYWSAFLVNGLAHQSAMQVSEVASATTDQVDAIHQHQTILRGGPEMRTDDVIEEALTLLDYLTATDSGRLWRHSLN